MLDIKPLDAADTPPDYAKIWMTLGKLTTGLEALAELQQSQAKTIQRILDNFGRFDSDQRKHRGRIADLEKRRLEASRVQSGTAANIRKLRDEFSPAVKMLEALATLVEPENRCACAETCDYRS